MLSPATNSILTTLTASDTASACGITVRSSTPGLALCRKLIAVGQDPDQPMQVWRGPVLCLRVRSIGEAAGIEVNGQGTGFIPSPVRCPPKITNSPPGLRGWLKPTQDKGARPKPTETTDRPTQGEEK
jgi:hypothetical protein